MRHIKFFEQFLQDSFTNSQCLLEQEISNINAHKKKQLDIILKTNPMRDEYHTGVRKIQDIKTLEEIVADTKEDDLITNLDFGISDIRKAIETKSIVVYSSYPIQNGVFVTPSKMEAQNYAGGGKSYSMQTSIYNIAWIDSIEGVFAKP